VAFAQLAAVIDRASIAIGAVFDLGRFTARAYVLALTVSETLLALLAVAIVTDYAASALGPAITPFFTGPRAAAVGVTTHHAPLPLLGTPTRGSTPARVAAALARGGTFLLFLEFTRPVAKLFGPGFAAPTIGSCCFNQIPRHSAAAFVPRR